MKYGLIKRKVLEHLNRATLGGEAISPAYNGQRDDLSRIPGAMNEAVMCVCSLVKPRNHHYYLEGGEAVGDKVKHPLPEDFRALKGCGVWEVDENGDTIRTAHEWWMLEDRAILTPKGRYLIDYYRYPRLLPEDPEDDYEYDEEADTVYAATFYAAAKLALLEDEFVYNVLMHSYEKFLDNMMLPPWCGVGSVWDAYQFSGGGLL